MGTYTRITSVTKDSVLNDPLILKQIQTANQNAEYKYNSSKCKIKREISLVSRSNSIKQRVVVEKRGHGKDHDKIKLTEENNSLQLSLPSPSSDNFPDLSTDSGLDTAEHLSPVFSQPPYLEIRW